MLWPSPKVATLAITTGPSTLTLPVRPPQIEEAEFSIPIQSPSAQDQHAPTGAGGMTLTDSGSRNASCALREKVWELAAVTVPEIGTRLTSGWTPAAFKMNSDDPTSCVWRGGYLFRVERGTWVAEVRSSFEVTSSPLAFQIEESIEAFESAGRIFQRSWSHSIERDLM